MSWHTVYDPWMESSPPQPSSPSAPGSLRKGKFTEGLTFFFSPSRSGISWISPFCPGGLTFSKIVSALLLLLIFQVKWKMRFSPADLLNTTIGSPDRTLTRYLKNSQWTMTVFSARESSTISQVIRASIFQRSFFFFGGWRDGPAIKSTDCFGRWSGSVPGTHMTVHNFLVPGYPMSSSDLCSHCAHMISRHACR